MLGTFQISIPVTERRTLLEREERLLAVLRWIAEHIPHGNRWYPVFRRYLTVVGGRVSSLGGDPATIEPSPTGYGKGRRYPPEHGHRPDFHHEGRVRVEGKVAGLVFDRFGDFEAFTLDTEHGPRTFFSRESEVEELAARAWRERLRLIVWAEHGRPERLHSIVICEPPAPFLE